MEKREYGGYDKFSFSAMFSIGLLFRVVPSLGSTDGSLPLGILEQVAGSISGTATSFQRMIIAATGVIPL